MPDISTNYRTFARAKSEDARTTGDMTLAQQQKKKAPDDQGYLQHCVFGGETIGAHVHRVLVVDDDAALRYAIVKLLKTVGYSVVEAYDYRDALRFLEDGSQMDVLVVDILLPVVHGFALARMARMKHPNIKCIHVTAHDLPTREANGPILRKPFSDDQLLAEVANALAE